MPVAPHAGSALSLSASIIAAVMQLDPADRAGIDAERVGDLLGLTHAETVGGRATLRWGGG